LVRKLHSIITDDGNSFSRKMLLVLGF
jgi:hypothetical protein